MNKEMMIMFGILFVLFSMQSIGGAMQIKEYRKAFSRVHKYGNMGIGQRKGFLFTGYLVMVACDREGIITYAEILDGAFIFSKFHPIETYLGRPIVGTSIYDYIEEFALFDEKTWKQNKGYVQAMEALARHLNPEFAETDQVQESEKTEEAAE